MQGLTILIACLLLAACAAPTAQRQQAQQQQQYALLDRIRQLENDLRALRGDLEQLQYRQNTASGDPDLGRRVAALERAAGFTPSAAAGPGVTQPGVTTTDWAAIPVQPGAAQPGAAQPGAAQPGAAQPGETQPDVAPANAVRATAERSDEAERAAYNAALDHLREGHYPEAVNGFQAFLNAYPNSPLVGEAYYWLGETHYTSRDFEPAKRAYLTLGARYPNSPKLPDALLKLGYIYSQLGEPARAREMLQKLVEAFPDSSAASQGAGQVRGRLAT